MKSGQKYQYVTYRVKDKFFKIGGFQTISASCLYYIQVYIHNSIS